MVWSCTDDGGKLIAKENSYLDLMGEKKKPEGPRTQLHSMMTERNVREGEQSHWYLLAALYINEIHLYLF